MEKFFLAMMVVGALCCLPSCASYPSDMWFDETMRDWHENGQKMYESTYKDGELISEKWWNAKGEEVETEEESYK